MSPRILLESRDLVKRFGGITATDHVTFSLPEGARHALIGPNGAGKTTFINLLSGVLTPTSGEIFLDGANVTNWSARKRAHAGLARTFQINQLFSDLTPIETLMLTIAER
jgi:branched-chain amino acid transport system ATP-binding protein